MSELVPEFHLFIVWSRGRDREREILSHLAETFQVLDVLEVAWTRDEFSHNLTRFYGEALPSGSEKEEHCGNDSFLVIVVRDQQPRLAILRVRADRTQVVDLRTLDAKELYRSWTGGGHRVHATLEPREFAHDLFLLLGKLPSDYVGEESWDGEIKSWQRDFVGTDGWRDADELLAALELTLGRVALVRPVEREGIAVAVDDPWWAAVVANGKPGLDDPWASEHVVDVAGRPVRLQIERTGPSHPATGGNRLQQTALRLRARAIDLVTRLSSRKAGLALVYHEVGDPPGDPGSEILPSLGISEFVQQLEGLKRRYRLVPASKLPAAVRSRRRGTRFPVSLTFDDDLASHGRLAAPILSELGLPATFFLNGTWFEGPSRFWWQDLQSALDGQVLRPEDVAGIDPAEVTAALARRPGAARRLAAAIEQSEPSRRRVVAARLRELAGDDRGPQLRADDVRSLSARGFEIGFHTLEHPRLTLLTDAELKAALADGRERLEAESGRAIRLLSYPHGKADDRVAAAASAAPYDIAYAGGGSPVRGDSDPMMVPRWEPPPTGGAAFELAVARAIRS